MTTPERWRPAREIDRFPAYSSCLRDPRWIERFTDLVLDALGFACDAMEERELPESFTATTHLRLSMALALLSIHVHQSESRRESDPNPPDLAPIDTNVMRAFEKAWVLAKSRIVTPTDPDSLEVIARVLRRILLHLQGTGDPAIEEPKAPGAIATPDTGGPPMIQGPATGDETGEEPSEAELNQRGYVPMTVRDAAKEFGVSPGTAITTGIRARNKGKIIDCKWTDGGKKLWILPKPGHPGTQDKIEPT